jgi:hypothetical protein
VRATEAPPWNTCWLRRALAEELERQGVAGVDVDRVVLNILAATTAGQGHGHGWRFKPDPDAADGSMTPRQGSAGGSIRRWLGLSGGKGMARESMNQSHPETKVPRTRKRRALQWPAAASLRRWVRVLSSRHISASSAKLPPATARLIARATRCRRRSDV